MDIFDKAEGIFLWLRVVVKYLMEQIGNGHGLSDLRKSVQELPLEMEGLFRQVLMTIGTKGPWLRQRAYQIFAMVKKIDDVRKSFDSDHRSSSIYMVSKTLCFFRLPLVHNLSRKLSKRCKVRNVRSTHWPRARNQRCKEAAQWPLQGPVGGEYRARCWFQRGMA